MRSISRVCDVSTNTVAKILEDAGKVCMTFHDKAVRDVTSKRVQMDEIWSFTAAKQKNVAAMKKPVEGATHAVHGARRHQVPAHAQCAGRRSPLQSVNGGRSPVLRSARQDGSRACRGGSKRDLQTQEGLGPMSKKPATPLSIAKRLNDHHMRTCAGFYASGAIDSLGRCFQARVRKGALEVTPDFGEHWHSIDWQSCAFNDHNGRRIWLGNDADRIAA